MFQRVRVTALALLVLSLPRALSAQEGWERRRGENAHIRIGSNYTLPEGSILNGPLLLVGGNAQLDGTVEDDVTVVGGNIRVGPTAVIRGDLNTLGGAVDVADGAQISGQVDDIVPDFGTFPIDIDGVGERFWAWLAAWLTVLRLSFALAAGILLAAVGPYWMRSIGSRVTTVPGWSLLTGLATELLITPAVVALSIALIITIVGIPLLAAIPVLLAVLAVLWIAGFTAVAMRVGATLLGQRDDAPVRQFLAGFLAICGVTILSQALLVMPGVSPVGLPLGAIGLAIEYIAWTVGLGAAVLTAFNRNGRVVPPPIPPEAAPQYAR